MNLFRRLKAASFALVATATAAWAAPTPMGIIDLDALPYAVGITNDSTGDYGAIEVYWTFQGTSDYDLGLFATISAFDGISPFSYADLYAEISDSPSIGAGTAPIVLFNSLSDNTAKANYSEFSFTVGSPLYLNVSWTQMKPNVDLAFTATTPVPLPAALPLLAAGLGGLALVARRRRG